MALVTTTCPIPRTMATTSLRSPTSCDPRRRRRAGRSPPAVQAGERVVHADRLRNLPCRSIVTRTAGTSINGGEFMVPDALGNKTIHPYSDFLLHDIGTGDGIPFLPTPEYAATASQIRTAPLWALRTRNRLMHDGLSFTTQEAITRHAGQAAEVTAAYNAISARRAGTAAGVSGFSVTFAC